MMNSKPLIIGYSGALFYFRPESAKNNKIEILRNIISKWLWEYRVNNVDYSTRTAIYLFKAIKKLKENCQTLHKHLSVEIWGNIHNDYIKQIDDMEINDIVTIQGYIPKNETREKIKQCDVMFLPLETSTNSQKSFFMPAKMFDYLQFKKPVLLLSKESDASDVIVRAGLGIVTDPKDIDEIADKIKYLIDNRNNLSEIIQPDDDYIYNNYHFKNISKKLAHIFDQIVEEYSNS